MPQLHACGYRAYAALHTAFAGCVFFDSIVEMPGVHGRGLSAFVSPLPVGSERSGAGIGAVMFYSDRDAMVLGLTHSLQSAHHMTPAKAALTEALVRGQSPVDFPDLRSTTLNTVRTQMKKSAAKVGAERQVDLVRIVLAGPAMLRSGRP